MDDGDSKSTKKRQQQPMAVRAQWGKGERTVTWDALWQRIFCDILRDSTEPMAIPITGERRSDQL